MHSVLPIILQDSPQLKHFISYLYSGTQNIFETQLKSSGGGGGGRDLLDWKWDLYSLLETVESPMSNIALKLLSHLHIKNQSVEAI